MAKEPLAIVTMCYNEPDFLPVWLKYYRQQVPAERLYIIDHGSTDSSTFGLAPANVVRIPRTPLDEMQRCQFITQFCNALLQWYDCVAYTDVDEILVADPRYYSGLAELSRADLPGVTTALGVNLAHCVPEEPALVPMAPILRQRGWVVAVGSESKPSLVKRPVTWSPGFHYADADSVISDLFLFHLAYCDMPTAHRRQSKRRGVTFTSAHGGHHSIPEDALVSHLESWSLFPREPGVSLDRDCPARARFVQQLFAAQPPGRRQIDVTVAASTLWQIPERFRSVF